MGARDYQSAALKAVSDQHKSVQSTLVCSPTGTGKTVMFCIAAKQVVDRGGRVMVLVDRTELVHQTYKSMEQWTGITPDVEQAELAASTSEYFAAPIVVATVQTMRSRGGTRKERFDPKQFDLLICDEAHLSITKTTIDTIEWFKTNKNLKVIGFTATPKRDDNRSLGVLYDSCAFQYTISQATKDGWLVPCIGRIVHINELSLAKLPGGKRDWTAAEIGRYMEVNDVVLKTAQATIDLTAGKQTLVFCARVSQAEAVAKRINFIEPDTAAVIHGKTPADERRKIINDFNAKRIKRIINCGVLTTGFDSPGVECIVNARPTKSWALFTQIVGRALRPLPGIVDNYDTPDERRAAIAASDKPRAEIISLVGREQNMDLASPVDVLAGDDDRPEVVARAKEIMEEGEQSPEDALIKAEEEIDREMRMLQDLENAPIRVHANYEEELANLYEKGEFRAAQAGSVDIPVQREVAFLISAGFTPQEMRGWSGEIVRQAIEVVKERYANGLASKKQCNVLAKIGIPESRRRNMSSKEANVIIGRMFSRR